MANHSVTFGRILKILNILFQFYFYHFIFFTFPDFSGDCLILSYEGGALRIGDGDPEAVCAEVP